MARVNNDQVGYLTMDILRWLSNLGRLTFIYGVIAQAIIFSVHLANVYRDQRFYACALIAFPSLVISSIHFFALPQERRERPSPTLLAYALVVVVYQAILTAGTPAHTHGETLLLIGNIFTPCLFLVNIAISDEIHLNDAGFVMIAGLVTLDAFDATDAFSSVDRNAIELSSSFRSGWKSLACILLMHSAVVFTFRPKATGDQSVGKRKRAFGLHGFQAALNTVMFAVRVVLYEEALIGFSVMIAKNVMVCAVHFAYMLNVLGVPFLLMTEDFHVVIPTIPHPSAPPSTESTENIPFPPQPLPLSSTSNNRRVHFQYGENAGLYPSLSTQVRFENDHQNQ